MSYVGDWRLTGRVTIVVVVVVRTGHQDDRLCGDLGEGIVG